METNDPGIAALRAMAQGPQDPEPPRKSRVVDLLMSVSALRKGGRPYSPHHQPEAEDEEKVRWEFQDADALWRMAGDRVHPDLLTGKNVLDVGCGWGGKAITFAKEFKPARVVGFDLPGVFDPAVPEVMAERLGVSNCEFTVGRAERMPFEDHVFDVALIDDVLEHVEDPATVLKECRRVIRPGGTVIAKLPSIRMVGAHHFDRCLRVPGLHYVMPMRTWAAGFNHYLLANPNGKRFEPFSRVVDTPFRRGVTSNLNGMDLDALGAVVRQSGLKPKVLDLAPYPSSAFTSRMGARFGRVAHWCYLALRRGPFREPLSLAMILVAEA